MKRILSVIIFGLVACVLYGAGAGLRSDIGILLNPVALHCSLRYDQVSICIAVMQLVFGASQPFFGIIASKTSNRFVLISGAVLIGGSLLGINISASFTALLLFLGIIFGLGAGALAFGLVLTSAINFAGRSNAMLLSGMLNASAGMIGFILSPMLQSMLSSGGTVFTFRVMTAAAAMLIPAAVFVTSKDKTVEKLASSEADSDPSAFSVFRNAFKNRTYRLLLAGFSTCGFHMVIIESHLFSQFLLSGINEVQAGWAFSAYGIATIAGALLSGFLSTKLCKGRILGFYYCFRAVWVLSYIFILPKTVLTAVLFSVGLGMTGDATVSPTSGLVSENFSLKDVAALVGFLFFVHQIGAFLSAWLGGLIREAAGSYTALWLIDAAVCIFAGIMSLRIRKTGE